MLEPDDEDELELKETIREETIVAETVFGEVGILSW